VRTVSAHEPEQHADDDLRDRTVAHARCEVDVVLGIELRVDAAAVEERVDQPRARRRLVGPEVVGVAEVAEHELVPVRQVRQELARRVLRRHRDVERLPPIRSVSTFESRTPAYSFSSGLPGQPSSSRPPAQIRSVPGLPITEPRPACVA
jgi:hypothetical protein